MQNLAGFGWDYRCSSPECWDLLTDSSSSSSSKKSVSSVFMFDPRNSVSSSLEPTTNLGVEFSPSLEVVGDDIAASVANHPALELQ